MSVVLLLTRTGDRLGPIWMHAAVGSISVPFDNDHGVVAVLFTVSVRIRVRFHFRAGVRVRTRLRF